MLRAVEGGNKQGQQKGGTPSTASFTAGRQIAPLENRLVHLQTMHGNQGMQRLLRGGVLQRKLTINQPGDVFEQEADRVAEAVMRMTGPAATRQETQIDESAQLRRCACGTSAGGQCEECKTEAMKLQRSPASSSAAATAPSMVEDVLNSPGRPLDTATRNSMESRFGYNFKNVRVHTGTRAAESARQVEALAYTAGQNIVFGSEQYNPHTFHGQRLLAHELAHVVQQGGAAPHPMQRKGNEPFTSAHKTNGPASTRVSDVIQRAGDPAAIPLGFACPTDLTAGRPAGTDLLFPSDNTTITPAHTALLTAFRTGWLAAGGHDDILVHGYASTDGPQAHNWTLSCDRAQNVRAELIRLGIPPVRVDVVAHGESTDFGAGAAPNRHAVVTSHTSILPLPLITGTLTARDNFASRSTVRFGVGETIDLNFFSFPPRPAADFNGLKWFLVSGGGALVTPATNDGTGTYTAPAITSTVVLELRVATGATVGRVISTHTINIVIPNGVRMVAVPGTAPTFAGTIPAGTWGAGFQANVFIDPKDVSFQGVVFGEGTVAAVVSPVGSFLSARSGLVHPVNTFGAAHGGNATTGTAVSPPVDNIANSGGVTPSPVPALGISICGNSDFLWAIPWEFSVAGSPRARFATANHHLTSTLFCNATIEKGGAGPFCRRLNGTTC